MIATTRPTPLPRSLSSRALALLVLLATAACLPGCGGGGGDGDGGGDLLAAERSARTLFQYGYDSSSRAYSFGFSSIASLEILNAPADTDISRFGMAHDGQNYYLFCGRVGTPLSLYSFRYSGSGYEPTGRIHALVDVPADADLSNFAILHNGQDFRLYLRNRADPTVLHQLVATNALSNFAPRSGVISRLATVAAPADADFSRWAMVHVGGLYRQLVFQRGSHDAVYQFAWNGGAYEYGHRSVAVVRLVGTPAEALTRKFAVLHDGSRSRLYQLGR